METAIQLDNVKKIFNGHISLKNISFQVKQGDIFGYLGANGAGKTTTIRILLDLLRPSYGQATILGHDSTQESARRQLGFVLDADGLYNNLSARENLDFYSRLYGLSHNHVNIDKLLNITRLSARSRDKVGTFSKGMRQRLSLARALVHDPRLLILDEPLSGIDPQGRIDIRDILLHLVQEEHKTIFFSSHNLDEVQRICTHIALIDKGEILLKGELSQLIKDQSSGEVIVELESPLTANILDQIRSDTKLGLQKINDLSLVFIPQQAVSQLIYSLAQYKVAIASVSPRRSSLEDIYSRILHQEGAQQ